MGVREELSKKLRDSKLTPYEFATSNLLHGKRIGIDVSVLLHKSIATDCGAAEFYVRPKGPNSEVIEKCSRLCGFAKRNEVTLVVSVDGMYHPMKQQVNTDRGQQRTHAKLSLDTLVKSPSIRIATI